MSLRKDQLFVASLIPTGARVLDIACGEGELLTYLEQEKQVHGQGMELDAKQVSECVSKGLSVIQADADKDLIHYPDNGFDYVLLGQAMQVFRFPKDVLEQALRIGQRVIVASPNFAHYRNRFYLLLHGQMPVTKSLSYSWYETPNIHFSTLSDMAHLAEKLNCTIEARYGVTASGSAKKFSGYGSYGANMMAETGVFVLRKN